MIFPSLYTVDHECYNCTFTLCIYKGDNIHSVHDIVLYGDYIVARAYRPQRGRGHVTAIHDSVPSKIQIRQWFVTNYSNSCCLDCISAMD